jgi:hypothetical protein
LFIILLKQILPICPLESFGFVVIECSNVTAPACNRASVDQSGFVNIVWIVQIRSSSCLFKSFWVNVYHPSRVQGWFKLFLETTTWRDNTLKCVFFGLAAVLLKHNLEPSFKHLNWQNLYHHETFEGSTYQVTWS